MVAIFPAKERRRAGSHLLAVGPKHHLLAVGPKQWQAAEIEDTAPGNGAGPVGAKVFAKGG